jgi:2,3-dihydro-2,3-dihydroxybenzoate dehydrogenase
VVVTGAASGIGAAVTELLLERGAQVAAWDLQPSAPGHGAFQQRVDVADERAVEEALELAEREIGPVSALVNAAGVLVQGHLIASDTSVTELRRAFAVNVEGVWNAARAVGRRMRARGHGAIVTVASNAGSVPRLGLGAYCASKAAAAMLTRCFGLELSQHGIRCNVVSPGSTATPMLRALLGEGDDRALISGTPSEFRLGIPLGRVAEARDVAEAVVFLISERARHITLQDLRVDGGATL